MADNIPITPGSGASVATDEIAGVHYPISKLAYGPADTATPVTDASGLPVKDATVADLLASIGTLNDTMLVMLSAVLEKLPRINGNDRVLVELSESGTMPGLTAVTSVSDILRMQALGTASSNITKVADGMPLHLANAGAMHLYNNIIVS